ncbi:MAG: sensor domain-containing diguanylate cyclase [Sulfuricurvum sp.]|uniref:sensor domain-containing diguanylate cyclase n=1 Tax=Sulfuricurvum sp. TaxID=2025608 RepID=UPI00273447EB|nr:sensor domain-containing diguanylate cyclase [Sulfuricurvum sp.]MDP2849699.1 sensor domain-containing diguanylate cyclase [Sulfuricurvum sp.]
MKNKNNFYIVITVSILMIFLSISISLINFMVSLHATETDLKTRSLPLTVDNIYTEIQKHVIEPNLVASMMAHDTFLKDWLINDEQNSEKIIRYLETIKNKYGMFVAFLVSEKTQSYYTQNGFLEHLSSSKPNNAWYFNFKKVQENNEINLDFNNNLDNSLIMFINHKIYDNEYHLVGATGIGLKISYINDMLKRFRQEYNFTVMFVNEEGQIILSERTDSKIQNLSDTPELKSLSDQIIVKDSKILEYQKNGENYLLKTKYIPELDLYLLVEAKLDDFTANVRQTFYLNLAASLLVTVIITFIILLMIRGYNEKLEFMARNDTLTGLMNRSAFNDSFNDFLHLSKRNGDPLSLIFFDIDNFKTINDTLGHQVGDSVLIRIAELLKARLRRTDIVGRWGGEEFILGLIDTDQENAEVIAETLRSAFEEDARLIHLAPSPVTASFGIVTARTGDTIDTLLTRADSAMYRAKELGKNRIETALEH